MRKKEKSKSTNKIRVPEIEILIAADFSKQLVRIQSYENRKY